MALIIPVGFGQAVYEFNLIGDNEPMVTTMGHDLSGVVGGDYAAAADLLFTTFATNLKQWISNQYEITGVTLYVGQDGGPPAIFESTSAPQMGGSTATPLPQNCAYLVRKRTSAAGRRGRGRMYIPGVPEADVSPTGVLGSNVITDWTTNLNAWLAAIGSGGTATPTLPPVILHREEGLGIEPPPTPVTALQIDNVIATQRRRLRR